MPDPDRIVSCHRGFERILPTPADVDEVLVLCYPPPEDGEPLFPECRDCEECKDCEHGIAIMPDDAGVFHRVKFCMLKFRDVGVDL